MKLGIIGTSNIAEAVVRNFIKFRVMQPSDIYVYDSNADKLMSWAGLYDVIPCNDIDGLFQNTQILFLAVDKKAMPKLITNINMLVKTYRPLVVSFAKGISLEELEDLMDFITPMARIMTNLSSAIGSGVTAYTFNELVSDEQKGQLVELFSTTGQLVEIIEEDFDCFSDVSNMSSVIACQLVDTIIDCGVSNGLTRQIASKTALQSIIGTLSMILEGAVSQNEMLEKLTPPSSTTLDGFLTLKESGFDGTIIKAFKEADK